MNNENLAVNNNSDEHKKLAFMCSECNTITVITFNIPNVPDSDISYVCKFFKCPGCGKYKYFQINTKLIPVLQVLLQKGYLAWVFQLSNPLFARIIICIGKDRIPVNFIDPLAIKPNPYKIKRMNSEQSILYCMDIPIVEGTDCHQLYEWANSLTQIPIIDSMVRTPITLYNRNFNDIIDEKSDVMIILTCQMDKQKAWSVVYNIIHEYPEIMVESINTIFPMEEGAVHIFKIHGFVEKQHLDDILRLTHHAEGLYENTDAEHVHVDVQII